MVVQERWYLVKDRSRAVREGDPAAAYLLLSAGDFIGDALAKRYGMLDESEQVPDTAEMINARRIFEDVCGTCGGRPVVLEITDGVARKLLCAKCAPILEASTKAVEAAPENKAVSMPPQVKRDRPRLLKRGKRA